MITPNDVKYQLLANLPQFTEEFGERVSASAEVAAGAIKITSPGHGLASGDAIVGANIKVIIPVTNVAYNVSDAEATLTMAFEHDRTSYNGEELHDYSIATLRGFTDEGYNGDFTVKRGSERETILIDNSADDMGAALGEMVESRNLYLGFLVVTVIDDDTFTIVNEDSIPNGSVFDTFDYVSSQQIFIAADTTRAVTRYAQHVNQPALFIVFGNENASKDRNTVNDSVISATAQNPMHLTYIPEVNIMYIASTKTEHLAAEKQQLVYEKIRPALRRAMQGFRFDNIEVLEVFAAVESTNGPVRYNTNNYVHNFVYTIPYRISIEQGYLRRRDVSFRQIIAETTIFNTEITLDAELEI